MKTISLIFLSAYTLFSQTLDSNWVDLFNGVNFDGWYSVLKGELQFDDPTEDPQNHYKIMDSVIVHDAVEGSVEGYLSTDSAYSRYHFRVEYKLGDKCTLDNYCKNSGLMYVMIRDIYPEAGRFGDGIECNMYFDWPTAYAGLGIVGGEETRPDFGNFGTAADEMNQYTTDGEWNLMEIMVWGADSSKHFVNGQLGGWAKRIRANGAPVTEGRIALQIEGNDVMFRKVQIRDIDKPIDILGCTDSLASNFDPQATKDDGSCEIVGITSVGGTANTAALLTHSTLHIGLQGTYHVTVKTLTGKTLYQKRGQGAHVIDFKPLLTPGLYLWQVKQAKRQFSGKLLLD